MKITSVNIHKEKDEQARERGMRGVATVVFDDCFVVHGIRIIEKNDKLIVAMPNRKARDGRHHDTAHPINQDFRVLLDKTIIDKYNEASEEE